MSQPEIPTQPGQLLIALATYNERESLPGLVARIHQVLPMADVLVVDDDSPDGTGHWCESNSRIESRFHCILRAGKLGLGSATSTALEWGLERGYSWIGTLDADGSHDPASFALMIDTLSRIPQPDVVIGSRYVRGGVIEGWPWRRRFFSRCVNILARAWLGLLTFDNSGSLRIYRAAALNRAGIPPIRSRGFAYLEEVLYRLRCSDARIIEVPITYRDRFRGQSKLTAAEILLAIREILWIRSLGNHGRNV